MEKISRTIPTSEVSYSVITVDKGTVLSGNPIKEVFVGQDVDEAKARKAITKKFPDINFAIVGIVVKEAVYEMSLEFFLKNSTIVEPKVPAETVK